ncbi:hypothetical protein STCU_04985 [Strigomonas culicis]|uniref:Uncharacterized protein n=1 Tax=Strigomonas culicis TaxID=28005 RepID=S9VYA2_9TRYP|nr:hypothetical protein STCU_04985 [Strigomonas culicis]|eukprot:EPY28595.1 hypothetical protein STCU_04985 [Strigomonas culicis]
MSHLPSIGSKQSSLKKKAPPHTNVEHFSQRECVAYIAQLKGLLDEATAQPPVGVDTAEVERRMALLQSALSTVEERHAELQRAKEAENNQRYLDNIERRLAMEREDEEKRVYKDKERRGLVLEMKEQQTAYYHNRNQMLDEKAAQCRDYNEELQVQTITKAGANEERRTRNIEHLMEERDRQIKDLHDRAEMRQEYARQVNHKKEQRLEADRRQLAETTRLREQEIENKLEEMRESKRTKWVAKKQASRAKSKVVWENGEAILETEAKYHDRLVKDLDEKVKKQQQRHATEQAERDYELRLRAHARQERQERQHQNLLNLIDKRVQRGDGIVKESQVKVRRGEETKKKQATQYNESGVHLRQDLDLHMKRATQLQKAFQNNALEKNYRRWNVKAARVLTELRDAMTAEEDEKNASERQHLTMTMNAHTDHHEEPVRPPGISDRLPSPSNFAV